MIFIRHFFALLCAFLSLDSRGIDFQLEPKEKISVSFIEEYEVSAVDISQDITFQNNEDYKIIEPSKTDPFLTLMRYFLAGANRDRQALLRLSTKDQNDFFNAISDEEFEIQLNSFDAFVNKMEMELKQIFEIEGRDTFFYGIEVRLSESVGGTLYLPFGVRQVDGVWLVDGGVGQEVSTVIRKQYPFTEKVYKVNKYPTRNRIHGY